MSNKDEIKKIREQDYRVREELAKALLSAIKISCELYHKDPEESIAAVRDNFKATLRAVDLPYNLLTIRAMIEGIIYSGKPINLPNMAFDKNLAYVFLLLWEQELIREKEKKLKSVNLGDEKK